MKDSLKGFMTIIFLYSLFSLQKKKNEVQECCDGKATKLF
jgi:hypothetical protein